MLDPAALERDLGQLFGTLGDLRERNPFGNSVKLLALELGKRLDAGKLSYGDIERLIQQLSAESYAHRAERLAAYLGERDEAKNEAAIRAAVRRVAVPDEAKGKKPTPRPFAEFQGLLERELFGIVMTAHPTFSQSTEMLHNLAELAMERDSAGNKLNAKERARRLTAARTVEHRPPVQIDLAYEHKLSIEAITNIQRALRRVYDIVFDVAAEFYPKDWEQLRPKLLTIASWVGYDLDGRSDIKWSDTLFKRLRVQTAQLAAISRSDRRTARPEAARRERRRPRAPDGAAGKPPGARHQGGRRRDRGVPERRHRSQDLDRAGAAPRQAHA